jgi:hypothetical protein
VSVHLLNVSLVPARLVAVINIMCGSAEYAPDERRDGATDWVFEWCAPYGGLDGFVTVVQINASVQVPQRAIGHVVVLLPLTSHLFLVPIWLEFDEWLGEIVIDVDWIAVLCIVDSLAT